MLNSPFASPNAPPAGGLLLPGAITGQLLPGAFIDPPVRVGARYAAFDILLEVGNGLDLIVRVSFAIDKQGALVLPADTALLAKWGRIVDAPPGRDWFDRLRNLWLGGRRLPRGMVLVFTIHPLAADRHALDDVEAVL